MKKNIALIIAGFGLAFTSSAQSGKLKKADNYYERVAYSNAADLYTDLLGSEVDNSEMKLKLADCYYQMGDAEKAETYFAQAAEGGEVTSESAYKYAQALKENGKYEQSNEWMNKFHSMNADDSRGKQFVNNQSYVERIKGQDAFFSINHLNINTAYTDFGGYPMGDHAYFVSSRKKRISVQRIHSYNNKQFLDLYSAEVGTNAELENADFQSRKVNKKYHEGPLCFTKDGKTVYFTRNNMSSGKKRRDEKGIQNLKLFKAQIDDDGNWTNEEELAINSRDYSVGHPTLSHDEKILYFVSDMPGGKGGADIYKMAINTDGTYGQPENLGDKINTEGQEMFPWMTSEGLLFFASDGHLGLGGLDVFVMIPKKDGSFNKLMNAGLPVNSPKDDFALIMNPDNVSGYVSSNRESGRGDDDIYSFKLLKPIKVNLTLKGLVTDKRSGAILPGAKVNLVDAGGKVLATTTADAQGAYEFGLEPELDYTITAEKDEYFGNQGNLTTKNLPEGTEELNKDLDLEKDPGLSLYAIVKDSKTDNVIEGVTMTITDNMTGESVTEITPETGDYLRPLIDKKLDDRGSYNFTISKEGYLPKTVTYNALFDREGQYDLAMIMDPAVEDLRDLIDINPINFDLGKWNIRKDAKAELDKIVEVMNKYPKMEVELGSHTDCRASKSFNMRLSDKRAKSSAAYIKSKITDPDRIYGKGYGESRLLNGCECEGAVKSDCSEEEHEKNRRTEFKVISVGNPDVDVNNNSTDSFDKN